MVVMLITVLNIMVAIALPMWSGMIRRDKEEELISRGLQYAEAIRVFQRRFGRLPVQLDELVKVEPRSIRRLWEDPMTGKNGLDPDLRRHPAGRGGFPRHRPANRTAAAAGTGPIPQTPPGTTDDENLPPPVGPIRGVRSRATGEAFKVFLDQSDYSSWEFRSDLFSRFRAAPSENGIPRVSALTLGRPFRYSNPGAGQGPGQFPTAGRPRKARRPGRRSRRCESQPALSACRTQPAKRNDAVELPTVRIRRWPHAGDLPLPEPATGGSAGADLRAAIDEELILAPGGRALVPTGFSVEIPAGWEGQVRPRSGLAVAVRSDAAQLARAPSTATIAARFGCSWSITVPSRSPCAAASGSRSWSSHPPRVSVSSKSRSSCRARAARAASARPVAAESARLRR